MTVEEAKKMLKAKLECLKRETSGTDIDCNCRNCDECNLCYEQGNMGEQREALDMAIKALEQQPCEDCISREDVMKCFKKWQPRMATRLWDYEQELKALPSVTLSYNSVKTELKPFEDCVSRDAVIKHLENITMDTNPDHYGSKDKWYQANGFNLCKVGIEMYVENMPSVTPKARWIPIKTRPMTEEEKEEIGHEYAYMYDCPLPDDAQDVLVTDCCGNVEVDTFCRDYEGCYFESNCDDGEVTAWQPLPQPYKAESEDKK